MTEKTVNAMPTKEFFIDMLTRDIPLIPAIVDLVDNSADGARQMKGNGSYAGLWSRLEVSTNEFRISDNCGGITVEIARKYAFRFGRASGMPPVKHSIGEFGVGMKRAIFKLGRKFKVESATTGSRFVVEEDVAKWAQKDEWEYEFQSVDENTKVPTEKCGTTITVTNLHDDVSRSFGLENFKTQLVNELKASLQDPISRGLRITLNGIPIDAEPFEFLTDEQLAPAYKSLSYGVPPQKAVNVRLYCGLGKESDPELAGWHVFCNGRLILEADKSADTGWVGGKARRNGIPPGFHPQYNLLRGCAYFDSDDPGSLPWNTTKTGLNTDSAVYRAAKIEMMRLMRPVVDFLNRLKLEKAGKDDEDNAEKGPLEQLLAESASEDVANPRFDLKTRATFTRPTVAAKQVTDGPEMKRIQYDMPSDKVDRVKKALKVRSFKDVGEKTFNYFYDAEIED